MKEVLVYQTKISREPFSEWFNTLDVDTQVKADDYIIRLAAGGSRKNIRSVGRSVFELKVDYGPGYRVYFGETDTQSVLLLLGGDKSTQPRDIKKAMAYWKEYNDATSE
ncbi:MAG: type II toxin-antitoxin system RelE/ParE family toxin [Acidobacteria bacterium]|nr:type II toxin-antitoxin system RelE/ParE family toxin [Acidobacteriota bacterium]MBI3658281.1 type II toxin-antitoxin system RelE/ParE family toxin [Acidobacteriota bacterium]